jgi:hypothetical protein
MIAPCKGCEERHQACHSTCEKYKEWKVWWDAGRQRARDDADVHGARVRSTMNTMTRDWRKGKQRKKGRFYE